MIVIVFTGGTIGMRRDTPTGGAVPALRGHQILALAPGIERIAEIEVDDWGHFPGPHMTPERMWALRSRLLEHLARPEVDGVVVTHGTDSLEETAYLLARSVGGEKPIVLTGAMRTSSDLGWDGPANLGASAAVAASPIARGHGTLVVMSDRIYSGLDVTKVHTSMVDAFESPGLGPLGVVDDGRVIFRRENPDTGVDTFASDGPAGPVDIVYAFTGADSRLLDASRAEARGIVIAAMGRGNVPPGMVPGIERFIAEGKPVIVASRAIRGRVGDTYGYEGGGRRLHDAGTIFAGARRALQARIDLMLALGAGMDLAALRRFFEG